LKEGIVDIQRALKVDIPKPEDVLRGLKQKAYAISGAEDPENPEVLKMEIVKLKEKIQKLEKEKDVYQHSFQEELALILDIKAMIKRKH